jgi:peptidoglycan glycosyltransferase
MAMVAAGIANGGVVMRPYLVDEVRSPDLDVARQDRPRGAYRRAISARDRRQLTEMMVGVVEEGTAARRQIPGIRVAGKTGTAQRRDDISAYAWFTSFAPADDPQVAVAVMIQNASAPTRDLGWRPRRPDRQGRHGGGDR